MRKMVNPRIVASEQRPRSILITKEVYRKIYPFAEVMRTVPVIFSRVGGRAEVEQEIADYLAENYAGISIDPLPVSAIPIPVEEPEPVQKPKPEPIEIPEIEVEAEPEPEQDPEPEPEPETTIPAPSESKGRNKNDQRSSR